jgi:hypothetical protein
MSARYDRRVEEGGKRMPRGRRRSGILTMELLLNLPLWLLLVLAVVQFGGLSCGVQQASLASRVGAAEAGRTTPLPCEGGVPGNVLSAIERQLASSGLVCSKVILEHNLAGRPVVLLSGCGPGRPPCIPLPSVGTSVRVTVCVPPAGIIPNLLGKLGLDLWSRALVQSTTFRHET